MFKVLLKFSLTALVAIIAWNILSFQWPAIRAKFDDAQQSVVEAVNPVAKEERLLGELSGNLDALSAYVDAQTQSDIENAQLAYGGDLTDDTIGSEDFQVASGSDETNSETPTPSPTVKTPETIEETKKLIEESRELVSKIDEINDKKVSTISSQVSGIQDLVAKVIPDSGTVDELSFTDDEGNAYICVLEE